MELSLFSSELADELDTSLSKFNHHLDKLCEADLAAVVDAWYSEKGSEMKVYGPGDGPAVLAGTEERATRVRSPPKRIVGASGLLTEVSVLVQWFVENDLNALLNQLAGKNSKGNGEKNNGSGSTEPSRAIIRTIRQ